MNKHADILELLENKSAILHGELRSNTDQDPNVDTELYTEILSAQIEVIDEMIKEIKIIIT